MNFLAMAASLKQSNLSSKELDRGRASSQNEDLIKEQLRKVKQNRSKNHDQITDAIYEREADKYESLYKDFKDLKQADENRTKVVGIELLLKQEHLKQMKLKAAR